MAKMSRTPLRALRQYPHQISLSPARPHSSRMSVLQKPQCYLSYCTKHETEKKSAKSPVKIEARTCVVEALVVSAASGGVHRLALGVARIVQAG